MSKTIPLNHEAYMPVSDFLIQSLSRDIALRTNDFLEFKQGYIDSFKAKRLELGVIELPTSKKKELKNTTAVLYTKTNSLRNPIKKLERWITNANLDDNLKDLRAKINQRNIEGVLFFKGLNSVFKVR